MDLWLSPVAQHSCKVLSQFEGVFNLQLGYMTVPTRKLFERQLSADNTKTLVTPHHIFLTNKSFPHPSLCGSRLMRYNGQAVSCHSKQQVESLLLARVGWSNILSLVWKHCGLAEAQCAVVNTVFIEVLAYWHLVLISGLHNKELCILCGNICYPVSSAAWLWQPNCLYVCYNYTCDFHLWYWVALF